MGDEQGFKHWARKIVSGGRWINQMETDSVEGKETLTMDRGKWVWWLENPERRVRKWGWRKRVEEGEYRLSHATEAEYRLYRNEKTQRFGARGRHVRGSVWEYGRLDRLSICITTENLG